MRNSLLTGSIFLLTAGSVLAQPQQLPATTPPVAPVATPSYAVTPSPSDLPPNLETTLAESRLAGMTTPHVWASAEYMVAWYNPMRTGPLIQTLPSVQAAAGAVSTGSTYYPNDKRIDFHGFNGVRATVGATWDEWGVQASGFVLQQRTENAALLNDGTPVAVAQGYIVAGSGDPKLLLASIPGQYSGGVAVHAKSQLWGADANLRREWYALLCDSAELLIGFKYLDLRESLAIDSPSIFPNGSSLDVRDSIRTQNNFYGGYVGYHAQVGGYDRGLGFDFTTKTGVGGVDQRVDLVGSNTFVSAGGVATTQAGGLYARGLNSGTFSRTRGAFMQDVDLKLTYNFNRYVQVSLGYSFQFLSSVVRPGKEIDRTINDSTVPFVAQPTASDAARPTFRWRAEELAVNALTFGLRVQY